MGNVNNEDIKSNDYKSNADKQQPALGLGESDSPAEAPTPKTDEVIQQPTPKMGQESNQSGSQSGQGSKQGSQRVGAYNGPTEESKSGSSFGSSQNTDSQSCDSNSKSC